MNDRRRQKLRAMDMMIRSETAGMLNLSKIVSLGHLFLSEISKDFAKATIKVMNADDTAITLVSNPRALDCKLVYSEPEKEDGNMSVHIPCEACKNGLGGGHCRINLEAECREGGGFEAFEPKTIPDPDPERVVSKGEKLLRTGFIVLLMLSYPLVLYKLYQWIAWMVS